MRHLSTASYPGKSANLIPLSPSQDQAKGRERNESEAALAGATACTPPSLPVFLLPVATSALAGWNRNRTDAKMTRTLTEVHWDDLGKVQHALKLPLGISTETWSGNHDAGGDAEVKEPGVHRLKQHSVNGEAPCRQCFPQWWSLVWTVIIEILLYSVGWINIYTNNLIAI